MHFYETREKFFGFFKEQGHAVVPSSSLIPQDPSVLLTTAGMQQFKRYYTGELSAQTDFGSSRAVSIQKCFRTSDFEEVGDNTHLTFFEMLGNFSFGPVGSDDPRATETRGYFKRAAIVWGYEFLTERLGIDPKRITVTVFEGDNATPRDEESFAIWHTEIGLPKEKIQFGVRADNFWGPTGSEGPCGPTTEIYVDGVEVWNIVFNEYYGSTGEQGMTYEKMKLQGIDTGMGFERLLTILENKKNIYETSAFVGLVEAIRSAAPTASDRDVRVLADHIRGATFLISDGVEPANKEAGYILRRLLRNILALSTKNDIHEDIFSIGYAVVADLFSKIYPAVGNKEQILSVWREEKEKFEASIARGLAALGKYERISGTEAFHIYESYGIPFELIMELAPVDAVKGLKREDFDEAFAQHQSISRAGSEKKFGGHGLVLDTGELKAGSEEELAQVIRMHTATHLLQSALRSVVDPSLHQMGSDITPERMRFDFNLDRKLTDDEMVRIEAFVNDAIARDLPVFYKEMSKDEAGASGALSFFREKYPERVKVYFIGGENPGERVSAEFCGGPHVASTGEIGKFKLMKQESVGKGVRRLRAQIFS